MKCPKTNKIIYRARTEAQRAQAAVRRRLGYTVNDYWCRHCSGWHLGNTSFTHISNYRAQKRAWRTG